MTDEATIVEPAASEKVVELSAEQKRARRRMLAQQAIGLAMQGRWEEALGVNQEILILFPDDPEASNRIGNSLSELSRVHEAIEAYESTLNSQPTNVIAHRNLGRLRRVAEAGDVGAKSSQKLPPAFFVEEIGKTGIASLGDIADPETVARVAAGDEVAIRASRGHLEVTLLDGTLLGRVGPSLAERLVRLLKGGNKYQAGVVMVEPNRVRILLRETSQAPAMEGKISFPPKTATVRGYTRDTMLRRAGEEDEDMEGEMADGDVDDEEDDENPAEFGFSETSSGGDPDVS